MLSFLFISHVFSEGRGFQVFHHKAAEKSPLLCSFPNGDPMVLETGSVPHGPEVQRHPGTAGQGRAAQQQLASRPVC